MSSLIANLSILFLLAVGVWVVVLYNLLVRDRNRVLAGWSDISVQLKRRHDLIPKLVEAVKQYAGYERATLEMVVSLRAQSEQAKELAQKGDLETRLGGEVHRLIALAEKYPDLKASGNFLELQREVSDVEDHIQYARRYYNGAVRNLNTRIDSFPDLLIARLFGYRYAEYFQLEDAAESEPAPMNF
jgi:LemA protein